MLTFANLAGLWALLGIPVVLAIHFLQRRSRVLTISTLFLLEQMHRQSVSGRRFERLRPSIPLWLQLLCVLLLTWMLIQPRWVRPDSVQRIAVVLDGSASMEVFRETLKKDLAGELEKIGRAARRSEYVAIDSRIASEPIYNGTELGGLIDAIDSWRPSGSDHDFGPALRVGRSLAGAEGLVVLATDHLEDDPPYDARLLAVGEPRVNVGFAGLTVAENDEGEPRWRALVRNYSGVAQERAWVLQSGDGRTAEQILTLGPDESRSLQGRFPKGADRIVLRMTPDDFSLDDNLPVVRPRPKPFSIVPVCPPVLEEEFSRILDSFDGLEKPGGGTAPDLVLMSYNPVDPPQAIPAAAVVLLHHPSGGKEFLGGRIAAGNDSLVEGFEWQGLIARKTVGIPRDESDTVLVWQGDRPLVFLRAAGGVRQLFFNFDFPSSNAPRIPAFVLLIHRFAEDLRANKVAPEGRNLELGQPVRLAFRTGAEALTISETEVGGQDSRQTSRSFRPDLASSLRAPETPAFFEIRQGNDPGMLLHAAAHFADTREADFRSAASRSDLTGAQATLVEQHTESDAWWRLWAFLLLAALVGSWYFVKRPAAAEPVASPT